MFAVAGPGRGKLSDGHGPDLEPFLFFFLFLFCFPSLAGDIQGRAHVEGPKQPAPSASKAGMADAPVVAVRNLDFRFDSNLPYVLRDVSMDVARGSRTLLIGANGAGKSSLLRILAGRHFHSPSKCQILGRPAFHDTSLGRVVAHLGERWGYQSCGDVTVEKLVRCALPHRAHGPAHSPRAGVLIVTTQRSRQSRHGTHRGADGRAGDRVGLERIPLERWAAAPRAAAAWARSPK